MKLIPGSGEDLGPDNRIRGPFGQADDAAASSSRSEGEARDHQLDEIHTSHIADTAYREAT